MWRQTMSLLVAIVAIVVYVVGPSSLPLNTRWTNIEYIKWRITKAPRIFTEAELEQYDGTRDGMPIYVAVDGRVFDVSAKPQIYGPTGPYHFLSGRDAARAYGTGCFETDLTHDLRDLDEQTLAAVAGWQQFFSNNPLYWEVGRVHHPVLTGEPPVPCRGPQKP